MALPSGATLTRFNYIEKITGDIGPYAGRVSQDQKNVLVVGGGIIGLVSAFRLAQAHHGVTLFDPAVAKGATWAAAGMVAPGAEIAPGEQSNYELQKGALAAWREVSHALDELTGEGITIAQTGTLLVGWDASDRRLIEQFRKVASGFEAPMDVVTRNDSPDIFEGVTHRISEGLLMTDDAWIDPDQIVRLLLRGLEILDVRVVAEEVLDISSNFEGVAVRTGTGEFRGDLGILATGAGRLPDGALTSGANVVRPIRGVTVRVQGIDRSEQPSVRAFVRGRAFYMVSRFGGYCVLGATAEERADAVLEVGELQRLLRDALDIVPELETARVLETRMGLRPASADLEPFFEVLANKGWAWSSGHYRHGVTLAPLAALRAVEFAEGPA
jgi:glycine oxidase